MNFDEYTSYVNSMVEKQEYEFSKFLQVHTRKNPPPNIREVVLHEVSPSPILWGALFAAISAGAVGGLRIFDRLYQTATAAGALPWVASLEALFGVLAVNLTLIILATSVAYTKKKHNQTSLYIGLGVAVFISFVAGLGQGFHGLKIDTAVQLIDWVLGVSLAAITALEYLAGDLVGVEYVRYLTNKEDAEKAYEKDSRSAVEDYNTSYGEWLANARKQFPAWMNQLNAYIRNGGEVANSPKEKDADGDEQGKDWRTARKSMSDTDVAELSVMTTQAAMAKHSLNDKQARRWIEHAIQEVKNKP